MKVVLLTGLSGSGKSVAIRALEDANFYCVDNLPPPLISAVLKRLDDQGHTQVAIAVDARSGKDIVDVPKVLVDLKNQGMDARPIFLDSDDDTLATRYSESRRRHPMSAQLGDQATVQECVAAERKALAPLKDLSNCIDTTALHPNTLRKWILDAVDSAKSRLTLVFETFGFKKGLPTDAELVFDVRCLSNPYYDKALRPLTGRDAPVIEFIEQDTRSAELLNDIEQYLRKWLPNYLMEQRSYVTVAIGCTGGQHRSVYIAETLAKRLGSAPLAEIDHILIRHRTLG